MSKWKRHANKFLRFQAFLLQRDCRCYFHLKCWQARTYKTFALPEITWCEISQILSRPVSVNNYSAHFWRIYGSIGKAREYETRRKSLVRVIPSARRLTTVWLRVITSLNHASTNVKVKERDGRERCATAAAVRQNVRCAYKLSCQLTNWKVRIGRTGFSMTAVRCHNCHALVP